MGKKGEKSLKKLKKVKLIKAKTPKNPHYARLRVDFHPPKSSTCNDYNDYSTNLARFNPILPF